MCAPRMRPSIKNFAIFYYLLSRAQSNVITNFLYFIFYTLFFCYLLIAICYLFFSCVCVCAKKCGVMWCVYSTFFLFFVTIVYIAQNPITIYRYFYNSKSRQYTRHRMRPVAIDVAWSLCVCLLDTTRSHAKTDEPPRCYLGCGIGFAQETMPCPSRPVLRGLLVCCVYITVSYAKTDKPSRCHVGRDIGDTCPFLLCSRWRAYVELYKNG